MVDPTDWDLLQACEQLLAVGGVSTRRVEEYSQPARVADDHQPARSRCRRCARDVLDSAGISLPELLIGSYLIDATHRHGEPPCPTPGPQPAR